MANAYFELTSEFNAAGPTVLLSSGQAVVFYRLAIMSKDGDWIVREDPAACARVREVLARHGARYRSGAPLEPAWLRGGWSSHFEFFDARGARLRCDFVSRPPRIPSAAVAQAFRGAPSGLAVIDLPSLIATKQTQRAKDYPIVGALARLLPPELELRYTTDPDRVLELAGSQGPADDRPAVRAARQGAGRDAVVVALAREIDQLQQADRERLQRYAEASASYLREFARLGLADLPLAEAHPRIVDLAERLLPKTPPGGTAWNC